MNVIITFFAGSSIGYFLGKLFGGFQSGQQGLVGSLILNFESWQVHLHHWLIALILVVFLSFVAIMKKKRGELLPLFFLFFFGFCGGLLFQGITCYEDWYQIFIRLK